MTVQFTYFEGQIATKTVTDPWNAADGPEFGTGIDAQRMEKQKVKRAKKYDDAKL